MNEYFTELSESRKAALYAFAVVGFGAVVGAGIWLAIYSARYVPSTVSSIGAAAVALTSIFTPGDASLSVVPTASTTLPFGGASSTPITASSTPVITIPVTPIAGPKTNEVHQIGGGASTTPVSQGLPDLAASISSVGYLSNANTDSFIASSTTPPGMRPAVKFVIKNIGGSISNTWRFAASIPTFNDYLYFSQPQQALRPGDSIEYTLGFDQAKTGTQNITVTANFDHLATESDYGNNIATGKTLVQSVY